MRYTSPFPAPYENVDPTIMYPPSIVKSTDKPSSQLVPPNVLVHRVSPSESVYMNHTSLSPAPYDHVSPTMMYPPSKVCCTEYA